MSAIKNYIYNSIHQIVLTIIPFLTIPYISRILGAEGVGLAVFTTSIVQYFVFFGTLGNTLYGSRTIAYVKDNLEERSKVFLEIFSLKLLNLLFSTIIFFVFIFIMQPQHKFIYTIQSLNLLAAIFDISWFFAGMEDFKKIAMRGIIVRFACLILIFIFVKQPQDVWIYLLIIAISSILGNLAIWFTLPQYIKLSKIKISDIIKHLAPNISLFIPQIAICIYTLLDKTLIGFLTNDSQVGFYNMAAKIISMSMAFVGTTGVVLMPKMSNNFAKGNINLIKTYTVKSFKFVSFLAFPIAFGIFGISDNFVPWFFGSGFLETKTLMKVLSPVIIAMAWGNITGNQLIIPMGKEKIYTISVITGAILSCTLNLLLIPKYFALGACISLIMAEFGVTLTQMYFMREMLEFKNMFNEIWKYIISSLIMLLIIDLVGICFNQHWYTTILQTFIGIFVYLCLMFFLKCSTLNIIYEKFNNYIMKNNYFSIKLIKSQEN